MFELNTPDFEATKIWSGNLGKVATHAIVYAQLYTPDGKCHGLHTFAVPVRDPKTLLAYPGVMVGDQGEKIGLNGIDNGLVSSQSSSGLEIPIIVYFPALKVPEQLSDKSSRSLLQVFLRNIKSVLKILEDFSQIIVIRRNSGRGNRRLPRFYVYSI